MSLCDGSFEVNQVAAHFPWVEQPELFSKTILDFYRNAASPELA
jgi:hypothetical protein